MKDLSITQEYLLCALNEKGSLQMTSQKVPVCLLVGSIIELLQKQCVKFDEKNRLFVSSELPEELLYLKSLYEGIKNHGHAKPEKMVGEYTMAFTNKKMDALISDIGDVLIQKECVRKESGGMFGKRSRYIPDSNHVDKIVQKVKAELFGDCEVTDETVALVSLLDKSGLLKKYFSKHESRQLKARLKEIKESSTNQFVKQMVDYVDDMIAVMIAAVVNVN